MIKIHVAILAILSVCFYAIAQTEGEIKARSIDFESGNLPLIFLNTGGQNIPVEVSEDDLSANSGFSSRFDGINNSTQKLCINRKNLFLPMHCK